MPEIITNSLKLSDLGEREVIDILAGKQRDIDDCAVLNCGDMDLLLSTDLITRATHLPEGTSPFLAGKFFAAINLSDIAAMAGIPEGMGIRNREREIDILKTLPSDAFEESILNILFEFSIHYEEEIRFDWIKYSEEKNGVRYIKYAGKYENLIFLLSKILNAGSVIACHDRMVSGVMALAGHHIIDAIDNPDLIIKLNTDLNQDIIINKDIMLISEKFMENKKQIYNVAIE